jgi:hypothetical protein
LTIEFFFLIIKKIILGILSKKMNFDIIGEIENIETIAIGGKIKDIMRIRKQYGSAKWRKLKGTAKIILQNGTISNAEIHWYEAHGIGRRKMKIKRFLD